MQDRSNRLVMSCKCVSVTSKDVNKIFHLATILLINEYFNVINHSKKGLSFKEIIVIYHALDIKTRQSAVGASTILYVLRRNTGRSAIIMFTHAY